VGALHRQIVASLTIMCCFAVEPTDDRQCPAVR